MKITHKITLLVAMAFVSIATFSGILIKTGLDHLEAMDTIYHKEVKVLDNLRKIQLLFTEIDYRMIATQADIVSPIGSGEEFKTNHKIIREIWQESRKILVARKRSAKYVKNFDKGFQSFGGLAPKILDSYFNEDLPALKTHHEEWLLYKHLIFKSINIMTAQQQKSVLKYYKSNIKATTYRNYIVLIASGLVLILFGAVSFLIIRRIGGPMKRAIRYFDLISEGKLDNEIKAASQDEIGQMMGALSLMQDRLRENVEIIEKSHQDLKKTLEQVLVLKDQQDGDYFLTSLLIKPLGANQATEGIVNAEFLVKQKKTFKFRGREDEIGGDLNKASRLFLKDRPYTVFLNADAMGKSMQGAGGVLVLGSVFESVIERTNMSSAAGDIYPERWLKNTFIELQKIFESFDGSMLISGVFGLVDEKTGLMYFINAEHPFTVILRNREAFFIEKEMHLRKLGVPAMPGQSHGDISIQIQELRAGDIVVAGSDGRDDILIGREATGERIINDDENLFLADVQKSGGSLETLFDLIIARGELTDDLSLLKLEYKGQDIKKLYEHEVRDLVGVVKQLIEDGEEDKAVNHLKDALETYKGHPRLFQALLKIMLHRKAYDTAAYYAERYIDQVPGDTNAMYIASVCFRKIGELEKAADLGERVRLRDPKFAKNIVSLATIYMGLKHYDRAELMTSTALGIEPDNIKAKRIQARLEKLSSIAVPG